MEIELAACAKCSANVLGHFTHTLLDHIEHLNAKGAHRAAHLALVWHHIGRFTRMDHGDRNHASIHRFFIAADDGLKRLHYLTSNWHRIDSVMRQSRMATLAMDGDGELVTRRHHRPRAQSEFADAQTWPVVHAVHRLHGKFLKQAVFDHFTRTTTAFFGGLEDHIHRAVKVAVFRQMLRRRQQHGHVAVMAASVHLSWVLAGVWKLVELLHGQSVHIGAQADSPVARAVFDNAHHARGAHAAVDRYSPFGQLGRDHVRGALLLKAQFRMRMDVASHSADAGGLGNE